jgi:hypothetical protein
MNIIKKNKKYNLYILYTYNMYTLNIFIICKIQYAYYIVSVYLYYKCTIYTRYLYYSISIIVGTLFIISVLY